MEVTINTQQLNALVNELQNLKEKNDIIGKYSLRVNLNLMRTHPIIQKVGEEERSLKEKHFVIDEETGSLIRVEDKEEYREKMQEIMNEPHTLDLKTIDWSYLQDKKIDAGPLLPIIEGIPEEYEELLVDIEYHE